MKNVPQGMLVFTQSLRNYVRKLVHQECDVDDVLHDTYLKLVKSEQHIDNPRGYAQRVAQNIVFDMHRHHMNQPDSLEQEPMCDKSDLDTLMEQSQRIEFYQKIVANMPKVRQDVFVRYRVNGQSKEDIANELGLSLHSVDKHITRALTSLKQEMDKLLCGQERIK